MQKQIFFLTAFFSLLITNLQAQKNTFTPEEIRKDMAFLKRKFENIHPGMYHYMGQKEYEKIYDSLYNAIKEPMSYMDAVKHISPLVINLKDGHTSITHRKGFSTKKTKTFPFVIRRLPEKFYIAYNYSNDTTIVRGSEILSINDEPIPQIISKIRTLISVDNDNQNSRDYYAINFFSVFYLKYYGEMDSVKISYKLPQTDSLIHRKVACLTNAQTMAAFNKRYKKQFVRDNLSYKILDSLNKIAIIDITSFSMQYSKWDMGQFKFKKSLKKRFSSIKEAGIEHLIIDFRGNGGGYIPNVSRFLSYFAKEPFTLIDTLMFKKKAYFTIFKPWYLSPPAFAWLGFPKRQGAFMYRVNKSNTKNKPQTDLAYRNKTYFLVDAGCYSATTFTLNLAKDMGVGTTYIGEQVGGATWGSFAVNWQDFKLPNTKLSVHCPLMKLNHKFVNTEPKAFFLQPDFEVRRNVEELFKNNSNVIDFTVNMIKASKQK
ncbi:MAG: S41 family peptidase [Spirosomaceae bacterium]|nr:S41 family peptidase [Spirosomataceae bacterium]